jgi:hypothetical protein
VTRFDYDIQAWFRSGLDVRPSPLHGNGLFTSEQIAAGETISRFGGRLFHVSARHADATILPGTAVELSEDTLLAEPAAGRRDLSDYLNHSCDSNTGLIDAITLVAKMDIEEGSELTCDYAYFMGDELYTMQDCSCRSRQCRQQITGRDWRLAELTADLERWAAPFLRRRLQAAGRLELL